MAERIPKNVVAAAVVLGLMALAYLAYSRPGYFTSQTYLGGILLIECLAAAVWMYRKVFFPLIVVAFLLAGVDLPVGAFWAILRWVFLAVGALTGTFLMFRDRSHHIGLIHMVAMFAILSALGFSRRFPISTGRVVESSELAAVVPLREHGSKTCGDGA